jgi:hypothetical protein
MKKLFLPLVLVLAASVAFAQQTPVKFMASENIGFDDNIYLTENDKKSSFISTTRVGADYGVQIPNSALLFNANAMAGYNAYTHNASNNNYWDVIAGLNLKNNYFTVGNNCLFTSDPANNELTDRARRINNRAYLEAVTSKEKMFGAGVTFADTVDYYTQDINNVKDLNRNRIDAGAQFYYNMSPKTNFFVEYVYNSIAYSNDKLLNDSQGGSVAAGVKGQISPKVTGTAKVSYDYRDYADNKPGTNNFNSLLGYLVSAKWQVSSQTEIGISGNRSMEETSYINNRYFVDTALALSGSQKFYDRYTASLTVAYENMRYPNADTSGGKRSDDLYTLRPALDYQFLDWLSAGAWYQFRTRKSDRSYDYDNNRVGVFVKGIF